MRNIFKYGSILLITVIISACSDINQPAIEQRLKINTITKWSVDTATDQKVRMIFHKVFDIYGNVVSQEDFSNSGSIASKSTFTYTDNKSIEERLVYSDSGNVKNKSKTEYEYDNNRRIIRQTNYDNNGAITIEYEFDYDLKGNLIKKKQIGGEIGANSNLNIDYSYSNSGELVERVTSSSTGNVYRDSISYNRNQNIITIYKFNEKSALINKTIYAYNNLGNVTSESFFDSEFKIREKYVYEYSYFSN